VTSADLWDEIEGVEGEIDALTDGGIGKLRMNCDVRRSARRHYANLEPRLAFDVGYLGTLRSLCEIGRERRDLLHETRGM
jgi:hypothetical protein